MIRIQLNLPVIYGSGIRAVSCSCGPQKKRKREKKRDDLRTGQYIRHLRKAAGMTQKELADRLNISFQAVSKWENRDSVPDTGILLGLCDALGTTTDKLLNGGNLTAVDRRRMKLEYVRRASGIWRRSVSSSVRTAPSIPG